MLPALADNDSQNNPSASVVFDLLGTHTLIYSGDVSSPEGDPEDWIQFSPYNETVFASLECKNGNSLQISILENGQSTSLELSCNESRKPVAVNAGSTYIIDVKAPQSPGGLQYSPYTVKIQSDP
jgi:hypothetical protein